MSVQELFLRAISDQRELLSQLAPFQNHLQRVADAMMRCWEGGGKLLIAGNGGSASDSMHFAEELVARFEKNRRALAAIALCDPTVITCAANDFGFDSIFSRQVEALGNASDVFICFSTSGNSQNLVRAINAAKERKLVTVAFLGKDGGKSKGLADIELIIAAERSAMIQAAHQLMYHTLCEWVDSQVD